jgi:hypothetical protein
VTDRAIFTARTRTMPSQSRWAKPSGQTTSRFAMKSVSGAVEAANSRTRTGPVTSVSSDIGSVE